MFLWFTSLLENLHSTATLRPRGTFVNTLKLRLQLRCLNLCLCFTSLIQSVTTSTRHCEPRPAIPEIASLSRAAGARNHKRATGKQPTGSSKATQVASLTSSIKLTHWPRALTPAKSDQTPAVGSACIDYSLYHNHVKHIDNTVLVNIRAGGLLIQSHDHPVHHN